MLVFSNNGIALSLEPLIVEHCAPTLARLKVGSLFSLPSPCWDVLLGDARRLDALLAPKGLSLRVVRAGENRALCYLCREGALARVLAGREAAAFLRARGYASLAVGDAVDTLCRRMACCAEFPHEAGVFLGYPLADVLAFIERKGRGCACCGCWKAYGDVCEAMRQFERYDKCSRIYRRLYRAGRSLAELTVPG